MTHRVKCIDPFFEGLWDGSKTFEVRRADRDYQPGDTIINQHWSAQQGHSGRERVHTIGFVLTDFHGLRKDYCAFSLLTPSEA